MLLKKPAYVLTQDWEAAKKDSKWLAIMAAHLPPQVGVKADRDRMIDSLLRISAYSVTANMVELQRPVINQTMPLVRG